MSIDIKFYGRQGQPLDDARQWEVLFETPTYRQVALYEDDDVQISTIWLGIDRSYDDGQPLIFETAIIARVNPLEQTFLWRTEAEAREGHEAIVRTILGGGHTDSEISKVKEKYSWTRHRRRL